MHARSHRLQVRGKIWLEAKGRFALGDGGVRLLSEIDARGSIRVAAERVGWSYRHSLAYLGNAEAALGRSLVSRTRGGHQRGGATLTPEGHDLLARYRILRKGLDEALQRLSEAAFAGHA